MLEAIALAFGLAMDATAMAAVRGLTGSRREALLLPVLFGGFQIGMAALGWALGAWGGQYIAAWDHWIASGLLFLIGGKFLVDAWRDLRGGDDGDEKVPPPASLLVLLGLALATSIDAGAAGITLPLLSVSPVTALVLIGGITLACSYAGFTAGRTAGRHLGGKLSIVGALLLIALGVRILVEHAVEEPPAPAPTSDAEVTPAAPRRTSAPLDAPDLARLATLDVEGWERDVRTPDSHGQLEVRYTRAPHAVTVAVAPCFDCAPMDLEAWRAKEPALELLVPEELRGRPGTRWELGVVELGGASAIFTYYESEPSRAYALYWNDGANQIRAVAEVPHEAEAPASREELAELARSFVEVFTRAW